MAEQYDGDIKLSVTLDAKAVKKSAEELRSIISNLLQALGNAPLSENFDKMRQSLEQSVEHSKELTNALNEAGEALSDQGAEAAKETAEATQELVNQVEQSNNDMRQQITEATGALRSYEDEELQAIRNAQIMGRNIANVFSTAAKRTTSLIRRFRQLASQIAKMSASIIKSGISKLGSFFFGGSRGAESFTQRLHKGIRTVLAYGLGIQTLASLFNKLRSAAGEAFKMMAQQIPEVNRDISSLKSSLQNLKNSIGTMFQPLLAAVTPILNRLLALLTQVTTKIGEFFAALTGQKYIYKATAANIDYAKSLDKSSKSQKKQNKENEKALGDYDKLQVIQRNKTEDNDDGAGGAGDGGMGTYQKVPIDPKWLKIADWLKDMWKKADFTQLGKLLGEKLRDALNKIPWDYIKYIAGKLGKSLATLLNGFFEVPGLARSIGNTIAQTINTALEFAYEFVKNFHWDSFGKFIGELISSSLRNIDWHKLRDFAKLLGAGIAEAINNLVNTDALYQIGNAIGNVLRAAIDLAFNLITGINFEKLGQQIVSGIKRFFAVMNEVDETGLNGWQKLGKAISDAIIGILHTLNTVLGDEGLRDSVGKAITDFLNQIDFVKILSEAQELIINLAKLFLTIIKSALESDTLKQGLLQFGPQLALIIGGIFTVNLLTAAAQQLAIGFLRGFGQGLLESGALGALMGDLAILCTFIISSVIAIFAGADIGKKIGKFMFPTEADVYDEYQGITGTFRMLKDFIEAIIYELQEAWGLFKERTIEHFQNLKERLGGVWNLLMQGFEFGLSMAANHIIGRFKIVYDFVMKVIQNIVNALNFVSNAFSTVQNVGANVASFAKAHIPGLANGAVIPPNNQFIAMLGDQKSGTNIETPLSTMVDAFKQAIQEMGGAGGNRGDIVLQLDGRTVAQAVWSEENKRYKQTGQYRPRTV